MKSLWQSETRREVMARLGKLKPTSEPRWGRMNCQQMVTHLADGLRMALGELEVKPRGRFLSVPPLKQLIVYWLPFPKGAPTAPELRRRSAGEIDGEVAAIGELLDAFARRDRRGPWPDHPAFGRLGARGWGVLAYRHLDHHLRQFGV